MTSRTSQGQGRSGQASCEVQQWNGRGDDLSRSARIGGESFSQTRSDRPHRCVVQVSQRLDAGDRRAAAVLSDSWRTREDFLALWRAVDGAGCASEYLRL